MPTAYSAFSRSAVAVKDNDDLRTAAEGSSAGWMKSRPQVRRATRHRRKIWLMNQRPLKKQRKPRRPKHVSPVPPRSLRQAWASKEADAVGEKLSPIFLGVLRPSERSKD